MNIFVLDWDLKKCAQNHVDRHVVSQVKESAQILSTAHRMLDGYWYTEKVNGRNIQRWELLDAREQHIYKSTHFNHPSVKWCRESLHNYTWLSCLFVELLKEYTYRYNKVHACSRLVSALLTAPSNISWEKPFTQPTPAMDSQYIVPGDSLASYRNYYKFAKQHLHSWKNREIPDWIMEK